MSESERSGEPNAHELPTRSVSAELQGIVQFAAASGDFNPIHFDRAAARRAGHQDMIVQGLLKAGWLADYATDAVGPGWVLEEYQVSYRGVDLVGRPHLMGGTCAIRDGEAMLALWGRGDAENPTTLGELRFRRIDEA